MQAGHRRLARPGAKSADRFAQALPHTRKDGMSLAQLRYQLENLQDADSKGHRMAWKVLYANRSQPLLVSTDLPSAQPPIWFFLRNPLLPLWGKAELRPVNWTPPPGLLPTLRLHTFTASLIAESVGWIRMKFVREGGGQ